MSEVFITVLNMSLTASYVAAAVILARLLLRKAPKIFSYALWAVVLFRMICPFSFESVLSLLPTNPEPIPQGIVYAQTPAVNSGIAFVDTAVNRTIQNAVSPASQEASVNPMQIIIAVCSYIWLIGIIALLGYAVISYVKIKRRIFDATLVRDNIFETDRIKTPFVIGFIKPKIYVPTGLAGKETEYIISHERTHIKRGDHLIKVLAFAALAVHWFNPLMWVSYFLMAKDMEMSCDERVMKLSDEDIRAGYSMSLLSLSVKQSGLPSPLAFGESNVKTRVKNVLRYKKPAFWISIVSVIAVLSMTVTLACNQIKKSNQNNNEFNFRLEFGSEAMNCIDTYNDIFTKKGRGGFSETIDFVLTDDKMQEFYGEFLKYDIADLPEDVSYNDDHGRPIHEYKFTYTYNNETRTIISTGTDWNLLNYNTGKNPPVLEAIEQTPHTRFVQFANIIEEYIQNTSEWEHLLSKEIMGVLDIADFDGDGLADEIVFEQEASDKSSYGAYPTLTVNFADGKTAVKEFILDGVDYFLPGRYAVVDIDGDSQPEIVAELQNMGSFANYYIAVLKYDTAANNFIELSTIYYPYKFDVKMTDNYQYIVSCAETGFASETYRVSDEWVMASFYNEDGTLENPDSMPGGVDGIEQFYTVQTEYGTGIEIHQYAWSESHANNIGYAVSIIGWKEGEFMLLSQRFEPYTPPVPVDADAKPTELESEQYSYYPVFDKIEKVFTGSAYEPESNIIFALNDEERAELWRLMRIDEWVIASDLPLEVSGGEFWIEERAEEGVVSQSWCFKEWYEQILIVPSLPDKDGKKICYFAPADILSELIAFTETLTPLPG